MAKVKFSPSVMQVRGRIGNWVYRKRGDGSIIALSPDTEGKPLSPAQLAFRDQFRAAVAYAKAAVVSADLHLVYELAAKARGMSAYAVAVGDFLKVPTVPSIDTSGYHGHVGNVIAVRAEDTVEVAGVYVTIRNAANAVLEQGAAVQTEGGWHYTATTAVANGTTGMIQAVATDHPGHTGELSVPLVVG